MCKRSERRRKKEMTGRTADVVGKFGSRMDLAESAFRLQGPGVTSSYAMVTTILCLRFRPWISAAQISTLETSLSRVRKGVSLERDIGRPRTLQDGERKVVSFRSPVHPIPRDSMPATSFLEHQAVIHLAAVYLTIHQYLANCLYVYRSTRRSNDGTQWCVPCSLFSMACMSLNPPYFAIYPWFVLCR